MTAPACLLLFFENRPGSVPSDVPGVAEHLANYVYLLIAPRTGKPFYVGKGTGERCFAHLVEARQTKRRSIARQLREAGRDPRD